MCDTRTPYLPHMRLNKLAGDDKQACVAAFIYDGERLVFDNYHVQDGDHFFNFIIDNPIDAPGVGDRLYLDHCNSKVYPIPDNIENVTVTITQGAINRSYSNSSDRAEPPAV